MLKIIFFFGLLFINCKKNTVISIPEKKYLVVKMNNDALLALKNAFEFGSSDYVGCSNGVRNISNAGKLDPRRNHMYLKFMPILPIGLMFDLYGYSNNFKNCCNNDCTNEMYSIHKLNIYSSRSLYSTRGSKYAGKLKIFEVNSIIADSYGNVKIDSKYPKLIHIGMNEDTLKGIAYKTGYRIENNNNIDSIYLKDSRFNKDYDIIDTTFDNLIRRQHKYIKFIKSDTSIIVDIKKNYFGEAFVGNIILITNMDSVEYEAIDL